MVTNRNPSGGTYLRKKVTITALFSPTGTFKVDVVHQNYLLHTAYYEQACLNVNLREWGKAASSFVPLPLVRITSKNVDKRRR